MYPPPLYTHLPRTLVEGEGHSEYHRIHEELENNQQLFKYSLNQLQILKEHSQEHSLTPDTNFKALLEKMYLTIWRVLFELCCCEAIPQL